MSVRLLVRPETPGDFAAIDAVLATCFATATDAVPVEVALVRALRGVPGFDPSLALVAELDGTVAGHLLFSPMTIEGSAGSTPALALAPLAVLPGYEGLRAGTRLMRAGLDACREARHRIVIVLGHAKYYRRFGFRPARPLGIEPPADWPDESFMALALVPGALDGVRGTARYAAPFGLA